MYRISVTNHRNNAVGRGNRVFAPLATKQEVVVDEYHLAQISACEDLEVEVLDDDVVEEAEGGLPRPSGMWTNGEAQGKVRAVAATENARKAAARLDVGLSGITGTGFGGEITEEDVLLHYGTSVERPIHVNKDGEVISGTGGYVYNVGSNGEENNPADKGTDAGNDKGESPGNDKGSGVGKANKKANSTSEG